MLHADYRIESECSITGPLLPVPGRSQYLVPDGATAVVMAAKSATVPLGQEIRVVHVPTGEVIFRKTATPSRWSSND